MTAPDSDKPRKRTHLVVVLDMEGGDDTEAAAAVDAALVGLEVPDARVLRVSVNPGDAR